nr:MAG TPA: hypothetical protein [Bacteriophage sp.]
MRNPKRLISHYTTSKRDNQYKFVNAKLIFRIKLLICVCEWYEPSLDASTDHRWLTSPDGQLNIPTAI